jgi:hypothetical protein
MASEKLIRGRPVKPVSAGTLKGYQKGQSFWMELFSVMFMVSSKIKGTVNEFP